MLLYPELYTNPYSYCLAVATYLDGYYLNGVLYLPKRKRVDITNLQRIPHMSYWSERLHRDYRKLPDTLKLEQFVILDDTWAVKTFDLITQKFGVNLNMAGRIAFFMWHQILFWSHYNAEHKPYEQGYVASAQQVAELCGCTVGFALKVIDAMLDAHLIYRKWTGNNLMGRGSCYLAGDEAHLDELLEKSNIADLT